MSDAVGLLGAVASHAFEMTHGTGIVVHRIELNSDGDVSVMFKLGAFHWRASFDGLVPIEPMLEVIADEIARCLAELKCRHAAPTAAVRMELHADCPTHPQCLITAVDRGARTYVCLKAPEHRPWPRLVYWGRPGDRSAPEVYES